MHTNSIEVAATLKMRQNIMKKELKKFMATEFKSMARIQDSKTVVVTAPDGEQFQLMCSIGKYLDEDYRKYELHLIEWIFDKCFSDDRYRRLKRTNIIKTSYLCRHGTTR